MMSKKDELIRTVLHEFKIAQETPWTPPPPGRVRRLTFPPLLPTGTEIQLPATNKLLRAIAEYAELANWTDETLKSSHRRSDWFEVVRRAFGEALYRAQHTYEDKALVPWLRIKIDSILEDQISSTRRDTDLVLGCWLFENPTLYPLTIGPVSFDARENWVERGRASGRLSKTTSRRLVIHTTQRKSARKRKSIDGERERWVADAIGNCPVVCTVTTNGLSSTFVTEKGVRAARLAMTTLSLMWDRPSQGLQWMHLLYDGPVFHQRYVMFAGSRMGSGSSLSHMPGGYNQSDLSSSLSHYRPYFDPLGRVLKEYLTPHLERTRPRVANALFLSLWWYHQACREESDQIATTKFAAALDSLAGGKGSEAIIALLGARLGYNRDMPLVEDGRTTKQLVDQIYNTARSRLIHGSSENFAHDWTSVRATAERIGRDALLGVCDWLGQNPKCDDINALRQI